MKIKQIEAILKQEKTIIVFEAPSCQWLSNGAAMYPVYGLPKLTRENIFTLFDIAEDKREKFYFEERELPEAINLDDSDSTEQILDRGAMSIVAQGIILEPLKTSQGLAFINSRYLKPFADADSGYELYERTDNLGRIYIAVKNGFGLLGIIATYDLISDDFVNTLESWLILSRIAWENKAKKMIEETPEPGKTKEAGK